MSAEDLPEPAPADDIIQWLTAPMSGDLHAQTEALAQHLDTLHEPGISRAQFHRCIELFYSRALQLSGNVRDALRGAQLPLSTEWQTSSARLTASLLQIAEGFGQVLAEAGRTALRTRGRLNETASARALRLLFEYYIISCQAGREPELLIWRRAHELYELSHSENDSAPEESSPAETSLFNYKRLLALGTLDPHSLSAGELDWSAEFITRTCGLLNLQDTAPEPLDSTWYWIDLLKGAEPQACARRAPPELTRLLFFSSLPLARRASELLSRHEGGRKTPELERSERLPGVHPASLLSNLRQRWHAAPKREYPRRAQSYRIEACVGLAGIWQLLRRGSEAAPLSSWEVVNESPGGYAIMLVRGAGPGLSAGAAVALRRTAEEVWSICVVRWLRSEGPDQIEMGLQIVSHGAAPVQVGFRNGDVRRAPMVDALVLPVLPVLRQHQAVLAPAGTYTSRRFSLVSDVDRLYVAQGRLLSLDMQTASIELFQFEIDPYPL
ncbi:hypothetical protein [Uliginosibacterium sediminicola]|uniref:Molecular chaperone n=1 Tax=Uliginosibacterium sediminicola TaxID=2024550 RepID=A0ABU9Z203_9RHOO